MKKLVFMLVTLAMVLLLGLSAHAADAKAGKEVYAKERCSMCHSINGVGGKLAKLDGVGSKLTAEQMKKWIKTPKQMNPKAMMKPYPNLSEKQLDDLVAYLQTLK